MRKVGAKEYKDLQNNQKSNKKSIEFKREFKEICDKASPGISHKLIALNFPEYIKEIICLNKEEYLKILRIIFKIINTYKTASSFLLQ